MHSDAWSWRTDDDKLSWLGQLLGDHYRGQANYGPRADEEDVARMISTFPEADIIPSFRDDSITTLSHLHH
jgi:hypothetical protein